MVFYNSYIEGLCKGEVDLLTDTIKVALLTSVYVPNVVTNMFFSDVSGNDAVGSGYTAGGATLASKTAEMNDATLTAVFDAADVVWANSTITARYAVIYKDTGVGTTSPLICYIDFGADEISDSGDFKILWDANGIFDISVGTPA